MPSIFISYSNEDEQIAKFVHHHLKAEGVSAFLASVSLAPGARWSPQTLSALKQSKQVVFLASAASCKSHFVQQELGVALGAGKRIIPILFNIAPTDLPGWMADFQSIDLRSATVEQAQRAISSIAKNLKDSEFQDLLKLGALLLAGFAIFAK